MHCNVTGYCIVPCRSNREHLTIEAEAIALAKEFMRNQKLQHQQRVTQHRVATRQWQQEVVRSRLAVCCDFLSSLICYTSIDYYYYHIALVQISNSARDHLLVR